MSPGLDSLLAEADAVLRLPASAVRVLELTQDPDTETETLVEALQVDPTFVAKLLRMANSPIYGVRSEVTELDRVVSIVGYQEIGQLAIAMAAARQFSKIETELLRASSFWRHSIATAVIARHAAKQIGVAAGGIFVAALLHDLGLPVQFGLCGDRMLEVLDVSLESDNVDMLTAEQQMLGFDHTEIGSALCELWNLPSVVVEAARYHHAPSRASEHKDAVMVVAWANLQENLGSDPDPDTQASLAAFFAEAHEALPRLATIDRTELLQAAEKETADMLALF